MMSTATIDAGICGFSTRITATGDDEQSVTFAIASGCEKIRRLGSAISQLGPVDAIQEISARRTGALTVTIRAQLTGCCAGCAVPIGIFKAMQVAAGLALPKDIHIAIATSSSAVATDSPSRCGPDATCQS
jgi:hypothetical protein